MGICPQHREEQEDPDKCATGSMSVHIKARLRWKEYEAKKCFSENLLGEVHDLMKELKNLKQEAEDKWIFEWTFHNPCNWTRRLIRIPCTSLGEKRR